MEQQTYKCTLCPRSCGAQRFEEYGKGYCKMGILPKISRAALHMWEEPCISGKNGSGTIFYQQGRTGQGHYNRPACAGDKKA